MSKAASILCFVLILVSACSGATPTNTPAPTFTPTTAASPAVDAIVFTVDSAQSKLNYEGTGLFGTKLPGTMDITSGTIQLVPEGDGYRVKMSAIFDVKSATALDSFIKNSLLSSMEADKIPTGNFAVDSKDVIKLNGTSIHFMAAGYAEIHAQKKPVEMQFTITQDNKTVTLNGDMTFKLSDYGVNVPSASISDSIAFRPTLIAQR